MDHNDFFYVDSSSREPLQALLGRTLWLVIGPIVLFVLILLIVIRGTGWFTIEDSWYFATMGVMVLGRWMEIRTGFGRTAFCKPATTQHFRRYVALFVPWALLVWTTANIVGNHLLRML
jgi:hypothetical protein